MNTQELIDPANALVADDKGLLAMDESKPICNKRFAKVDIPQTVESPPKSKQIPSEKLYGTWVAKDVDAKVSEVTIK